MICVSALDTYFRRKSTPGNTAHRTSSVDTSHDGCDEFHVISAMFDVCHGVSLDGDIGAGFLFVPGVSVCMCVFNRTSPLYMSEI